MDLGVLTGVLRPNLINVDCLVTNRGNALMEQADKKWKA